MPRQGRGEDDIRKISFERSFTGQPGGSVLVKWGENVILCTAMVEEGAPQWMQNSGRGWLTAEYAMLPSSTPHRKSRDISRLRRDGRSTEIQRLIGRSLRACVDTTRFPGKTAWIDCDVLQADGGTRTAAISGSWVALHDAFSRELAAGELLASPMTCQMAAMSVGIVDGKAIPDLCASEDQRAEVDMNVVMTDEGRFIEVQGSGEKGTFSPEELESMLELARNGIHHVMEIQTSALAESQ